MEELASLVLLIGFVMDLVFGDPRKLPHLIVLFGHLIGSGEKLLNHGRHPFAKGGLLTLILVISAFMVPYFGLPYLLHWHTYAYISVSAVLLFYCLANRTLIREGLAVFKSLEEDGLEAGRKRLSWIVGRETHRLDEQQIKKATFETMSENLSDGVIAPLFYFAVLGLPGAMAYKMINTLDSMTGYKSERYYYFGKFAAKLDDVANFIPARLTALLMLVASGKPSGIRFVVREGKKHSSPNAGYPEAALAYILSCRLGGPNFYHGTLVEKPFIGHNDRRIDAKEIHQVVRLNLFVSLGFVIIILVLFYLAGN